MMARTKRIPMMLIDDHLSAGEGVAALIRDQPEYCVLSPSAKIAEALRLIRLSRPQVVLLNLRQDGVVGLAVAGALHGEIPEARVVILGLAPLHEDVAGLVRAGVSGFIMADAPFEVFLEAVESVAHGIQVLPAELTHSLFGQLTARTGRESPAWTSSASGLTGRERAVTTLLAQGVGPKEIAARLQIALHVVTRHVHEVLSKLAARRRMEVAAFPGTLTS